MTAQELAAKEKQEVQEQERTHSGRAYVPDVDIREDESGMSLWVDMPGSDQEKVRVDLDDNVLTIEGDVSLEDYDGLHALYTEYNVGRFVRRFTLPDSVRFAPDRITARISNGVLEIKLPLAEAAKPRRIKVTAG
jgi:HSP20 family molecular chaperone IbpA